MADMQDYKASDSFGNVPEAVKDPTPQQMRAMIDAFLRKKRAYEALHPSPPPEKKKVEAKQNKLYTGGGRPRRRYTKTVTMVSASADGERLRLAGRGRPKAGVKRLKVDVPYNTRLRKGVEYNLVDGVLVEAASA